MEDAISFIESLPTPAGDKIFNVIHRIEGGEKNSELFKKLENSEIWEFRALYNRIAYRIFAFWDTQEDTLVIATHGIVKKHKRRRPKKSLKQREPEKSISNQKTKENETGWKIQAI